MRLRSLLLLSSLLLALSTAVAQQACLLSASGPGAYAARFWPDRVVLTTSSAEPVTVTVHLPQAVKWARLDETAVPSGKLKWTARAGASLDLPAGQHTVQLGWSGQYREPAQGEKVPVLAQGKPAGTLSASFTLERMQAEGRLTASTGLVRPRLRLRGEPVPATLSFGATALTEWQREGNALVATRPVLVSDATLVTLVATGYDLTRSPFSAIELEIVQQALEPQRLAAMPEGGVVIEAEDIAAEGLGKAEVSTKHFGTHGGKSIFNNSGEGHWLEYTFEAPTAGLYDLYVRAATQEPMDLRSVQVDGQLPEGLGLVRFPGTGGWGYSAAEWAALQLTAPSRPLRLSAGKHTLRLTGECDAHLNLDYFVIKSR